MRVPNPPGAPDEALLEARGRLDLVLDAASDGIWEWDHRREWMLWSPRAFELTGQDPGAFVPTRESLLSLVHPKDQPRLVDALDAHLRTGAPFRTEVRLRRGGDGTHGLFLISGKARRDEAGRPLRSAGSFTDITELRRAQRDVREGRERFAATLRGLSDGFWDWDLSAGSIAFSPRWKSMLGHGEEEIGIDPAEWLGRVHPDDREELQALLAAHLEGQTPNFESQHRLRHRDGRYLWTLSRGIALRGRSGKAYGLSGLHADVTALKRTEELLQEVLATTGTLSGEEFLSSLARHLAEVLHVPYSLVCEVVPEAPERLRTLSWWADGRTAPALEYDRAGTPCEEILSRGARYHPAGVAELFPRDEMLHEIGAESYLGVPLRSRDGQAIGHLCVLSRGPLEHHVRAKSILNVFAARAALELERSRTSRALESSTPGTDAAERDSRAAPEAAR